EVHFLLVRLGLLAALLGSHMTGVFGRPAPVENRRVIATVKGHVRLFEVMARKEPPAVTQQDLEHSGGVGLLVAKAKARLKRGREGKTDRQQQEQNPNGSHPPHKFNGLRRNTIQVEKSKNAA